MFKFLNLMRIFQLIVNQIKDWKLQDKIRKKVYQQKIMIKKKNYKIKIDRLLLKKEILKNQKS